MPTIIRNLNLFVQIEQWIAGPLPIEHDGTVVLVQRHFRCPAFDQIIIPPHTPIAVKCGKIARFLAAIRPTVMIGLVVRERAVIRKAANQATGMLVDLFVTRIEVAVNAIPDPFVTGQQRHGGADIN